MATDVARPDRVPMTIADLVSFTIKELESEAERARLQASSADVLPAESQAGTTLDLSNAKVHALPVEVLVLIKDKVERLALSHNHQISIPPQIVQCERLRYLNIRWNELTQFPRAILQLSNLEILDLSKNSITSIPEDVNRLSSLRFLAISNNKVTRLPLSIGDMTNLGRLKVDENPITFPPREVFKPSKDKITSRTELQSSSDVCQNVKRFLKETANKEKQKMTSEDELSESNAETPRPPKRTVTGGRFPIRPSISGIENIPDPRVDSPAEGIAPPIPQRSHARINSTTNGTNASPSAQPSLAPLATDSSDVSRSRSETTSSSASLRKRRQGMVPLRKATGDLTLVPETDSQEPSRLSQASTVKASHTRGASSVSTVNSYLGYNSTDGSSGLASPVEGPKQRFPGDAVPQSQRSSSTPGSNNAVKSMKRLHFTLRQLQRPIRETACALKMGSPERMAVEQKIQEAQSVTQELNMLWKRCQNSLDRGTITNFEAIQSVVHISVRALRAFGDLTAELKRRISILVQRSDGFVVRGLMFQIHLAMVELRNVCSILGFKVRERPSVKEPPRISQAWSSKSITPTQPKASMNIRPRNPTPLQNVNSPPSLRGGPPPPPVPLSTNVSRSNTMTSMSAVTPRSGDTFQIHQQREQRRPDLSRNNTMRSMVDGGDDDEPFHFIFLKLKQACDLAGQALPHLHSEFSSRRDMAQNAGQRNILQQWSTALKKCELVITNNKALKKRLEFLKIDEPGARYQRDFWQLCDAFVHSWTDLATVVKEIGSQRIDITTSKQIMRNVQKAVRDASKMISHSPLYHHAIGTRGPEVTAYGNSNGNGLAPPFQPSSMGIPHTANTGTMNAQGNYVVGGPATPLAAAIGPAAHSIQAPSGDYTSGSHSTSRSTHERVDTVMQPPPRSHSRRG